VSWFNEVHDYLIGKFRAVELEKYPAKTWPVKRLPVKTLASEAPRGHFTTGNFFTDEVLRSERKSQTRNDLKLEATVVALQALSHPA
jgi:hypothetical protein